MDAARKYLAQYSEPEIALVDRLTGSWDVAVALPLYAEVEGLPALLQSLATAAEHAGLRALAIAVVNLREDSPDEDVSRSREAQRFLADYPSTPHLSLLVVDRASEGTRFPPTEGVGLARKIGCDLALALWRAGRLASDYVWTTDGDARVSPDYFTGPRGKPAAVTLGYRHRGEDPAHTLYEISLRYYTRGLAHARSPYAFPTIGSTLCLRLESYAEVRGFPRRLAAEDFYLLAKLAKVGPVVAGAAVVELSPRRSHRVPFGTGAACLRISEELRQGIGFRLYPPCAFLELGQLIESAERAAIAGDPRLAGSLPPEIQAALATAIRTRKDPGNRIRHFHAWFDALRTLKLIHRVRDRVGMMPWREALREAPFMETSQGTPVEILERLRQQTGPTGSAPAASADRGSR